MGLTNDGREIIAGNTLIAQAIQSQNFVQGASGWQISADGDAEFNNGTFRGVLSANAINAGSIGGSTITGSDWQGGTIEDPVMALTSSGGGSILVYSNTNISQTYTAAANTFTVPAGVTKVTAQCWGGGGGGQDGTGPGGGGGEYSSNPVTVVAGQVLTINVGQGGAGASAGNGADGGLSQVLLAGVAVCTAHGGLGSTGQSLTYTNGGSGSTDAIHFNGGGAAGGVVGNKEGGGGGGGSGGLASPGRDGRANSGLTGGAGGVAVGGGGTGGAGGVGSTGTAPGAGGAGLVPGGGGGTGGAGTGLAFAAGGSGARGQIILTYQSTQSLIVSISGVAGTDQYGNSYPVGIADNKGHSYLHGENGAFLASWTTLDSVTIAVTFTKAFTAAPQVSTNIESNAGTTSRWSSRAFGVTTTGFTFWLTAPTAGATSSGVNVRLTWSAAEYT